MYEDNYKYEIVNIEQQVPAMILIQHLTGNERFIPLHWHLSLEIDLLLEDDMEVTLDGQKSTLHKGDLLFVNSEKLHSIHPLNSEVIESITILLSYDFIKKNYENFDQYEFDIKNKNFPREQLKQIMGKIKNIYTHNSELRNLELNILLSKMLLLILKFAKPIKKEDILHLKKEEFDWRVKLAIAYIKENYMFEIAISDILERVHLTHPSFSRLFKKETGNSFNTMLINYRIQKAYKDLISTELNLTDIAIKNGFTGLDNFRKHFKQIYRVTPSQMRRM